MCFSALCLLYKYVLAWVVKHSPHPSLNHSFVLCSTWHQPVLGIFPWRQTQGPSLGLATSNIQEQNDVSRGYLFRWGRTFSEIILRLFFFWDLWKREAVCIETVVIGALLSSRWYYISQEVCVNVFLPAFFFKRPWVNGMKLFGYLQNRPYSL